MTRHLSIVYIISYSINMQTCDVTMNITTWAGVNSLEWKIIYDALGDLIPFVQFKKREKRPWRSVTFSKIAGFSLLCITLLLIFWRKNHIRQNSCYWVISQNTLVLSDYRILWAEISSYSQTMTEATYLLCYFCWVSSGMSEQTHSAPKYQIASISRKGHMIVLICCIQLYIHES